MLPKLSLSTYSSKVSPSQVAGTKKTTSAESGPKSMSGFPDVFKRFISTIRTVIQARKVTHNAKPIAPKHASGLQVITHNNNVIGAKVEGRFKSIEDLKKNANTPELKTLIQALETGGNYREKGSQQKIGSKLYVDGEALSVNKSLFGKQKVEIGSVMNLNQFLSDIDGELDQLNKTVGKNTFSLEKIEPRIKILNDLVNDLGDTPNPELKSVKIQLETKKNTLKTFDTIVKLSKGVEEQFQNVGNVVGTEQPDLEKIRSDYETAKSNATTPEELKTYLESTSADVIKSLENLKVQFNEVKSLKDQCDQIIKMGDSFEKENTVLNNIKQQMSQMKSLPLTEQKEMLETLMPKAIELVHHMGCDAIETQITQLEETHKTTFETAGVKTEDRNFKEMYIDFQKKYAERFKTIKSVLLNKTGKDITTIFGKKGRFDGIKLSSELKTLRNRVHTNFNETELKNYLGKIQDLYLEKKYGLSMQTRLGIHYQAKMGLRTESLIDNDIKNILKEMIGTQISSQVEVNRLADNIKSQYLDTLYEEPLQQMQSTIDSDVDDFVSLAEQKDSYYSGMQEYGEMATGFSEAAQSLSTQANGSPTVESLQRLQTFAGIASSFMHFGEGYLVGYKDDILFGHDELHHILNDTLTECTKSGSLQAPVSDEMKGAFIEYAQERLKGKDLLINGGMFNFQKTDHDVQEFKFRTQVTRSNFQNLKRNFFTERMDKDIYRHNFANSSQGIDGGKQFFKAIYETFEKNLKKKLGESSQQTGFVGQNVKIMRKLNQKKTHGEQLSVATSIKLDAWRVRFNRSSPFQKISMLQSVKTDVDNFIQEGQDQADSSLEQKIKDKTGITKARHQIDDAEEMVEMTTEQIEQLDTAVETAVNAMNDAAKGALQAKAKIEQLLDKDSGETPVEDETNLNLSQDISEHLNTVTNLLKEGVDGVSNHLGMAENLIETAVAQLASNIPYYNQAEAAVEILSQLGQAAYAQHQIDTLRSGVESGVTLASFGTAEQLEDNPEFQKQMQSFTDLVNSKTERDSRLRAVLFKTLDLISPPGVRLGNYATRIYQLMSADNIDAKELKEVIKEALTVNQDFQMYSVHKSGLTGDETATVFFEHMKKAENMDRLQASQTFKLLGDMHVSAGSLKDVLLSSLD
ncbi:hypothetical protein DID76_04390 [Candidatus Marinamargulisbacteria bacterium SCGC AG-414-C22]|nr:hypothetical protein DID76_04390 [Candidatus Marinamargulisbacteria bacterium SCGC AG-414-C22]